LTSRKRFGTCVIAPKTNLERIRNSPNACKVLGVHWPRMLNRLYCTRDAIIGTNADPLNVVETSGLLIDGCASCVTSVRSVVSTVRHRSTNFDTGAKVTRIWHPVAPVTSGKRHQRSMPTRGDTLRLEVVCTISECSFARSAEHGVHLQPAMLWDISRVTASRQILERRVTRPTVLLRGNLGMLPNSPSGT
jgi:hypothetical protein